MHRSDQHALRRDLSALADGELDPSASRALLRRLLDEPAVADELRAIQQMSADARRAVRDRTPAPSAELMDKLQQLKPPPVPTAILRPVTMRLGWIQRAIAAAVVLAAGIGIGRIMGQRPTLSSRTGPVIPVADVIPAGVVAGAEEIHGVCSRLALGLHSAGYPADVAGLAADVERDLHSDHPFPDLTPIGYAYRGAGPCGRPLPDTAHLLYRSLRPGSVNAVSVFVQPWRGQYPLAANRVYTVSVAQSAFPMLAWRTSDVVYFLLSDSAATEQDALRLIRSVPADVH